MEDPLAHSLLCSAFLSSGADWFGHIACGWDRHRHPLPSLWASGPCAAPPRVPIPTIAADLRSAEPSESVTECGAFCSPDCDDDDRLFFLSSFPPFSFYFTDYRFTISVSPFRPSRSGVCFLISISKPTEDLRRRLSATGMGLHEPPRCNFRHPPPMQILRRRQPFTKSHVLQKLNKMQFLPPRFPQNTSPKSLDNHSTPHQDEFIGTLASCAHGKNFKYKKIYIKNTKCQPKSTADRLGLHEARNASPRRQERK
jgi:hypothetical protein